MFIFWERSIHFRVSTAIFCGFYHHLQCLIPIHVFNGLHMGIVTLNYPLPGTEQIIKEEHFQICLPSLCVFSCRFVNIGSFWRNIRCTFPPSDNACHFWSTSSPCADPGIFVRGVGVQALLPENSFDNVFCSPQLILQFYSGLSMVYFKENYNFHRFQRGSNIFQGVHLFPGGPTFSRGGGGGVLNAVLYRNP